MKQVPLGQRYCYWCDPTPINSGEDEAWEDDPCDHDHDWQEVQDAEGRRYLQCRNCDQLASILPKKDPR